MTATQSPPASGSAFEPLDQAVAELKGNARTWARTSPEERVRLLSEVRDRLIDVAPAWAEADSRRLNPGRRGVDIGALRRNERL
ncbi:hypothetical protein [Marinobacter daqiaonensis]|uniref:hypothetical protein n=1 Tax=Marinobacter daqiaonensis TaxID=650891 RepID=UPI00111453D2|nr:hypothetical protein [Marinobacter daqiaonensis]